MALIEIFQYESFYNFFYKISNILSLTPKQAMPLRKCHLDVDILKSYLLAFAQILTDWQTHYRYPLDVILSLSKH